MYIKDATKLFDQGKRSKSVMREFASKIAEAHAKQDAKKLDWIDIQIKKKTIQLFAMSLEACDYLGLPKNKCYDLYFKGEYVNPAILLRGMHTKGMLDILKIHKQDIQIIENTDQRCTIEFSADDGTLCRYTMTMEEALLTPWIINDIESNRKIQSMWQTNPQEMLLHEAVRCVCKFMFRRIFKAKSKTIQDDLGYSSNRDLAEDIFDEGIFDIESVDYNYLEKFRAFEMNEDEQSKQEYLSSLRTKCVNKICASLDLCDAFGLPKDYFYDVCKHRIYRKGGLASNVRGCCAVDVLRHFGHIVHPQELSLRSAMIRYEVQGSEAVEHISLDMLKQNNDDVKEQLKDPNSAWSKNTKTMLFYEVLYMAMDKCFKTVKVKQTKESKSDVNKRFFSEMQKYRQEPTLDIIDHGEDKQPQEQSDSDQKPKPHKPRSEFIIPQSYNNYMSVREDLRKSR